MAKSRVGGLMGLALPGKRPRFTPPWLENSSRMNCCLSRQSGGLPRYAKLIGRVDSPWFNNPPFSSYAFSRSTHTSTKVGNSPKTVKKWVKIIITKRTGVQFNWILMAGQHFLTSSVTSKWGWGLWHIFRFETATIRQSLLPMALAARWERRGVSSSRSTVGRT